MGLAYVTRPNIIAQSWPNLLWVDSIILSKLRYYSVNLFTPTRIWTAVPWYWHLELKLKWKYALSKYPRVNSLIVLNIFLHFFFRWTVSKTHILIVSIAYGKNNLPILLTFPNSIKARIAQLVAYRLGIGEVLGSNPGKGENFSMKISNWINLNLNGAA